jgi:hypothetical protein
MSVDNTKEELLKIINAQAKINSRLAKTNEWYKLHTAEIRTKLENEQQIASRDKMNMSKALNDVHDERIKELVDANKELVDANKELVGRMSKLLSP